MLPSSCLRFVAPLCSGGGTVSSVGGATLAADRLPASLPACCRPSSSSAFQVPSVGLLTITYRQLHVMAKPGERIVERQEMRRFMVDSMTRVGTSESHAGQLADVLLAGDTRGHYSHGLNRLDMYIRDIREGVCKADGEPVVLKERAASAWVDGNNLLGPVVGNFCTDLAVKKAKEAGVGWVVAKGSNHFGIAGWYTLRAMEHGCLGLSFTNTSPIMYPTRAAKPALGTNPLSLGAPGKDGDAFVLDMATTTVAVGKVEIASRKGQTVPASWGVAQGGQVSTDPEQILHGGGLLPLGGTEEQGGYKGYGLGALVEIFCGVLGGAHWGPNIRRWMSTTGEADLGQCFVAIDPSAFAPGFEGRLQELIDTLRNLPQASGCLPVEVAGDAERAHEKLVEELGGIPYHPNQIEYANKIAEELKVTPPVVKLTVP